MKNPVLLLFLLLNGFLHGQIVLSGDSIFVKADWKTNDANHYTYSTTIQRTSNGRIGPKAEAKSAIEARVLAETDTSYEISWKYSNFTVGTDTIEIPEWKFQTTKKGADPKAIGELSDPHVPMEIINFYGFYGLVLSEKDTSFLELKAAPFCGDTMPLSVMIYPVKMDKKTITIAGVSAVDEDQLKEEIVSRFGNHFTEDTIQKSIEGIQFTTNFECVMNRKDGNIILLVSNQTLGTAIAIWTVSTFRYELVID